MFGPLKNLIPQPHCFKDDDTRYNIGLTWIDDKGLTDSHNFQIQYARNNERWAIERGKPQPDGSWLYKEDNGCVHIMSAERVNQFMEKTQEHAAIMCGMLDKLQDSGLLQQPVETEAAPA